MSDILLAIIGFLFLLYGISVLPEFLNRTVWGAILIWFGLDLLGYWDNLAAWWPGVRIILFG